MSARKHNCQVPSLNEAVSYSDGPCDLCKSDFFDRFCNLMLEADEKLSREEYDTFERDVLVEVQKSIQWRERGKKTCRQVRGEGKYGCDCPADGIIPGCHCVCHD